MINRQQIKSMNLKELEGYYLALVDLHMVAMEELHAVDKDSGATKQLAILRAKVESTTTAMNSVFSAIDKLKIHSLKRASFENALANQKVDPETIKNILEELERAED